MMFNSIQRARDHGQSNGIERQRGFMIDFVLTFESKQHRCKLEDDNTLADVVSLAAEHFGLEPQRIIIKRRGRPAASHVRLKRVVGPGAASSGPVDLQVVLRPQNVTPKGPDKSPGCERVDTACANLDVHRGTVDKLEACSSKDWTPEHNKQLLETTELLERILLALDELSGLSGPERDYKKSKVNEVQDLCSRLDRVKARCTSAGLNHPGSQLAAVSAKCRLLVNLFSLCCS
eukprot:TRINITY_DN18635_c0_g1_i2.p1 TRINITY_DN18635_c0_g1~~TRINITY_DN18635_c0_g1_i2.p1  ORF type:complete len:233 (+),score=18.03 TRINITY_DN18635_c0_g1_i2:2-700(+)